MKYHRLSAAEKRIYTELKAAVENFRLRVDFYGASSASISNALGALVEENPEFFWLSGAAEIELTMEGRNILDVTCDLELEDGIRHEDLKFLYAKFNATVNDIVFRARQYNTHFHRVLFVHDYIADNTEFVSDAPMRYNAYGCLVDHRAVCAGYAKAFQVIMKRLGYECGYVSGADRDKSSIHSSHAWNYIGIGNDYYFVDLTWDDTYTQGRPGKDRAHHYFCITEQELLLTHIISGEYEYPSCRGTRYDYYRYNNYYLDTYSFDVVKGIADAQLKKANKFEVKFASVQELALAKHDLVENKRFFDIFGTSNRITYTTSDSGLILIAERHV